MNTLKSSSNRLREATVAKIHELRGAYDSEGKPQKPTRTYQSIATELGISLGTVYNVVKGRTHKEDVPKGHPKAS